MAFLPVTKKEIEKLGWDQPDFIIITADAYVDHPSFGAAVISRTLEAEGFRVAVIAQPDWKDTADFKKLGRPKYGFLIAGGNIDSMVAHYTAAKKRRSQDAYSPGNKAGLRPDRPTIVYTNRVREAYGDIPILIGGLEASLRRFAHYDYWEDSVRRSILADSGADILMYGMGERPVAELAKRLQEGQPVREITDVRGTCVLLDQQEFLALGLMDYVTCASFAKTAADKQAYARAAAIQYREQDPISGKAIVQQHTGRYLLQNPPAMPLNREEMDRTYGLPYERYYHPMYEPMGGVPAIEEVGFSIIHNRGCIGGCNFCSLAFHQGRMITSRSKESVIEEAKTIIKSKGFKGYIHDVGGPTANFRFPSCKKQLEHGLCKNKKCLAPTPCPNLEVSHEEYLSLLRDLRALPGVKKVFVRSGLRFDYMMLDRDSSFFEELVQYHVSGQLKVAPEHCCDTVLHYMGKPKFEVFEQFHHKYFQLCKKLGLEQYLVPYLMSSHPGSKMKDAVDLAVKLKRLRLRPEQVQDFYPTPGVLSTAMYYTEIDPLTMKPVYVPKSYEEKELQRALLQYYRKENADKVRKALHIAKREDLIGNGPDCLVAPARRVQKNQHTVKRDNNYTNRNKNHSKKGGKRSF